MGRAVNDSNIIINYVGSRLGFTTTCAVATSVVDCRGIEVA